tara:strand:+ start:467 stop:718 length:252 start_codon:yes stop_codon:yes gene_type:complete
LRAAIRRRSCARLENFSFSILRPNLVASDRDASVVQNVPKLVDVLSVKPERKARAECDERAITLDLDVHVVSPAAVLDVCLKV